NIITNGTLVYFEIIDGSNRKSISTGEVIAGKALIELVAPIQKTTWAIHAFIPGFADSSTETINFKSAIESIPFKSAKGTLVIGPIESFMGQYIKEGILVHIRIWNEKSMREIKIPVIDGKAELVFKEYFISDGDYTIELKIDEMIITKQITVTNE
ncbi:MAG: hypothetical protein AAFY41_19750, partial [Bacteroidota bacterium]